ncbi:unnamed protein product [Discula destructiva]
MDVTSPTSAVAGSSEVVKVVFVFVPGAFHPTAYFQPIRDYLHKQGHESIAIGHSVLDLVNPGSCFLDDAAKVEKTVKALLDEDKNVVLVMHSYGGIVGSQATGDLMASLEAASPSADNHGGMGKILNLFYVAALIGLEGESIPQVSAMVSAIPTTNPDGADLFSLLDIVDGKMVFKEEIKDAFYHDLTESERLKYYNLLRPMLVAGPEPITNAGWRHLPSTYIYAKADRIISSEAQRHFVQRADEQLTIQAAGLLSSRNESVLDALRDASFAEVPWRFQIAEIDSDHCSMFILPKHVEKLAKILIETCL